ncbi:MAG: sugar phosphate isomerase/epimerase [Clostridiales bacterium]|nr:sugar phosphate isomerase/epimerase [Clostridiales bacterium]
MLQIIPNPERGSDYMAYASKKAVLFEASEFVPDDLPSNALRWYADSERVFSVSSKIYDLNPASDDPLIREISIRRYGELCRFALKTGARNIVFKSCCAPYLSGEHIEKWAFRFSAVINELSEKYADTNLTFFIENALDAGPEPMAKVLEKVNPGKVKACLNVGAANCSGTPVGGWFDEIGEKIAYLRLSDNNGLFDENLPVGSGKVDWDMISRMSAYLPEDLPITIVSYGLTDTKRSIEYLRHRRYFGL